jgi:hypothetical protein
MTQQTSPRKIPSLTWVLVASPLLLLVIFFTLAVHVRIGLGHWPTPMIENYETTAYNLHMLVFISALLFAVYVAVPLWLISLCFRVFRISLKTHLIQAGVYAVGWALIVLCTLVDPCKFVEWFLD